MNYGGKTNPANRAASLAQQTSKFGEVRRDPSAPSPKTPRKLFGPKVNQRDLVSMTSQLAIMTQAGVDVAGALESLVRQGRTPALQVILQGIHDEVLGGSSLSDAMGKYTSVFGETYVASIAAGEASGRLPEVTRQLAQLLRAEMRLRNSVRTMLAYPVLLILVSSVVMLALLLFVLPQFETIFSDFDAPLPVVTRMMMAVSTELRSRFWLWLPLVLALATAAAVFLKSERGRRLWDRMSVNSFLLRDITRALLIGRTCRLLGIMIESGVPLLESLRLARFSVKNSLYRDLFSQLEDDVMNGRGLSTALLESEIVPGSAAEMVMTGEKTGTLGSVTQMIGEHFEEEGEAKLKEKVAVLEPAITVGMGVVVAVIVMSVMLPLFDLSSAAKGG